MSRRDRTQQATTTRDVVVTSKADREECARAALEALYERPLSDKEWARISQTLQAFAAVVTRWNRQEQPVQRASVIPVAISSEHG